MQESSKATGPAQARHWYNKKENKMYGKMRTIITLLIVASFCLLQVPAFAASMSDESVLGVDRWSVQNDGDFVPNANTYNIGSSTQYPGYIYLGGVGKASWGSIVSPWEDSGTATTLTSAPTKFILTHSTGDIKTTRVTTDDIHGTTNAQNIDLSTDNAFKFIDNSDTLTITASGDDFVIDSSDGGVIFTLTDATNGTVDIMANNDVNDYIQFSTVSNVPTIVTVGSCNLEIAPDGGTLAVTGILTVSGAASIVGATTLTSAIIGDDTIDVVVDDQLRFASNDEEATIEALGYTGKNGVLQLTCDLGADAGDKIQLVSDQATNSLFITSDTGVKDTHATILTLAKTGILTTTNAINGVNDSADTNIVRDILTLTHSTSGTAAAGLGTGVSFLIEDGGAAAEEQGSIDVVLTTATNGAEDADMVFSVNSAGAIVETLRIVAASSETVSDYLQFTANTTETNLATNVLVLKTSTGTAVDNYGMSISFQPEDATGSEEVASIDIIQTTAARATNDTDFVFSQNVNGTITERVRFDADGSNILLSGALPAITIGDAGEEDTQITFDGAAADFSFGLDDTADAISLSLGTALGTTEVFKADGTTFTVTDNLVASGSATVTGATVCNGAVTLGDAVTDVTTLTGKIAGATPLTFDGATANTIYTILAVADAASTSKTVTLPSITATIALETAATTVITADTTATITVVPGTDTLYTYTIDTDDENCTLTFSAGGTAGDVATIIFITDAEGSNDEVMTFEGTLSDAQGTLTLATGVSKRYVIQFISDGTIWNEVSRTTVLG